MQPVPVTPAALVDLLAQTVAAAGPGRLRVAVDGAPAAHSGELADALVEPLRALGRPTVRVRAETFWRPASLRLEHGRTDPHAYRDDWLDVAALRREVLDPFAADGRYLPALWNVETDRATRAAYAQAPDGAVLLLDGTLLLDRGLPTELSVHLRLSPAALRRRTEPEWHWTLPAYDDYAGAEHADVVVLADDPRRPAVVVTARR